MVDTRYAFCEVFVKDGDRAAVERLLAGVLEIEPERGVFRLDGLVFDVVKNGRTDGAPSEDFVLWPSSIEIEPEGTAVGSRVVEVVSSIIVALWDSGRPAVAACDYEDELPWAGGLGRL